MDPGVRMGVPGVWGAIPTPAVFAKGAPNPDTDLAPLAICGAVLRLGQGDLPQYIGKEAQRVCGFYG